jgi:hypothetical protein
MQEHSLGVAGFGSLSTTFSRGHREERECRQSQVGVIARCCVRVRCPAGSIPAKAKRRAHPKRRLGCCGGAAVRAAGKRRLGGEAFAGTMRTRASKQPKRPPGRGSAGRQSAVHGHRYDARLVRLLLGVWWEGQDLQRSCVILLGDAGWWIGSCHAGILGESPARAAIDGPSQEYLPDSDPNGTDLRG